MNSLLDQPTTPPPLDRAGDAHEQQSRVGSAVDASGSAASVFIHSSQDIPEATAPAYWHEPDSAGRYRALIVLCPQHEQQEQQVRDAGAAGVLYAPTGARWWLDGATT